MRWPVRQAKGRSKCIYVSFSLGLPHQALGKPSQGRLKYSELVMNHGEDCNLTVKVLGPAVENLGTRYPTRPPYSTRDRRWAKSIYYVIE